MMHRESVEAVNLDQYGNQALSWSLVRAVLEAKPAQPDVPGGSFYSVLGTVQPDGRPHAAPIGPTWIDGAWFIVSGPGTRKSRNLAGNPACTLTVKLPGYDVVFTGEAHRVTDAGTLERVAEDYREGGWPAEVEGDAFTAPFTAPSGGPPPWHVYRIDCHAAFAVGTTEDTDGATKWVFDRSAT